jgi:TldD protein
MRDLTERALDTATSLGAGYADTRVVRRLDESIAIKTGRVEGVASGESEGFGVRVLVDGAWGFASSHVLTSAEADRIAAEAVRIARASGTALREPADLAPRPAAHGQYETPLEEDPFTVPLEQKIADLLAADVAASGVKGIAFTESMYAAQREWKTFAATDGSYTEQTITHVGAAVEANAVDGDEHQRRSYPDSGGGWQAAGYEYIRGLDLHRRGEPLADAAVALLT